MTATVDEQIAWSLARCCRPGEVLVVGVATPIAAAAGQLARELLVPDLTLIEAAAVDVAPHDVATPMVRPEVVAGEAVGVYTQAEILDAIQRGRVTLQFISPAQVDGAGTINTSRVRAADGTLRRLPGGLAHADIACLIGRLVAYRAGHERRFLPSASTSSPAPRDGSRRSSPRRRCSTGTASAARLASLHEGVTREEAVAGCGFALDVPDRVPVTEPPPPRPCGCCVRRSTPTGCGGSRRARAVPPRSASSRRMS